MMTTNSGKTSCYILEHHQKMPVRRRREDKASQMKYVVFHHSLFLFGALFSGRRRKGSSSSYRIKIITILFIILTGLSHYILLMKKLNISLQHESDNVHMQMHPQLSTFAMDVDNGKKDYRDTKSSNNPDTPNRDNNLIQFDFDDDRSNNNHVHNQSMECNEDVMPNILATWKNSKQIICRTDPNITIAKYTMKRWEYQPTIYIYRNVVLQNINDQVLLSKNGDWKSKQESCTFHQQLLRNHSGAHSHRRKATVIRIFQKDPYNSYERFHAYINVAMTMAIFNVTNPQLVYTTDLSSVRDIPQSELDMWNSFSMLKPILITQHNHDIRDSPDNDAISTKSTTDYVKYDTIIDTFSSETSILVTKSRLAGPRGSDRSGLKGRGTDHHCKSTLVQGIVRWMIGNIKETATDNFNDDNKREQIENGKQEINGGNNNKVIQILWSSRRPYCCRGNDNELYYPRRTITNEHNLIEKVRQKLEPQRDDDDDGHSHNSPKYNIQVVDFANKTPAESIALAIKSDLMIGVHGAGLVWSLFLQPHGGLIELFGGDRSPSNRHYHNIASLVDVHYRSMRMKNGRNTKLIWNNDTIDTLIWKIKSFPFHSDNIESRRIEPEDTEPRYEKRPPRQ